MTQRRRKANELDMPQHPIGLFTPQYRPRRGNETWGPSTGRGQVCVLVAEASGLPSFRPEPMYNDACDVGICIRGQRGYVARFVLQREEKNRDGDTVAWHFVPLDMREAKATRVDLVTVFND